MSEWHIEWQNYFSECNRKVPLSDGAESHRADVLINGFVVEFQHSPITLNDFVKRNNFYTKCGYWKELMEQQKQQQLIKQQQIYILYNRPKEYIDPRTAMIRRYINGDINRLPNNFGYSNNDRNRKSYRRNFKRK